MLNILGLIALIAAGGVIFVAVGMGVLRAFDILENDYD